MPVIHHKEYRLNSAVSDFCALSYNGGDSYKYGTDSRGQRILVPHEIEDANVFDTADLIGKATNPREARFVRRQRLATYENNFRPIVIAIVAYIFSNEPSIAESFKPDAERMDFKMWARDIANESLKHTHVWLGVDAAAIVTDAQGRATEASVRQQDPVNMGRPYFVMRRPDEVVDWTCDGDNVTRVVILESMTERKDFASEPQTVNYYREWTDTEMILWKEDVQEDGDGTRKTKLVQVERKSHSFRGCPWVRVWPEFPGSDICELSKQLFNLQSLLDEEMWGNVFTQMVFTGVTTEQMSGATRGIGNVICLPDPQSNAKTLGSDSQQSRTIMDRIADVRGTIYRIANVEHLQRKTAPESGEKKRMDLESLYAMLQRIAEEFETKFNEILYRARLAESVIGTVAYSDEFDVDSLDTMLDKIERLARAPYTPVTLLKRQAAKIAAKADDSETDLQYMAQIEKSFNTSNDLLVALTDAAGGPIITKRMAADIMGVPEGYREELFADHDHSALNNTADHLLGDEEDGDVSNADSMDGSGSKQGETGAGTNGGAVRPAGTGGGAGRVPGQAQDDPSANPPSGN